MLEQGVRKSIWKYSNALFGVKVWDFWENPSFHEHENEAVCGEREENYLREELRVKLVYSRQKFKCHAGELSQNGTCGVKINHFSVMTAEKVLS